MREVDFMEDYESIEDKYSVMDPEKARAALIEDNSDWIMPDDALACEEYLIGAGCYRVRRRGPPPLARGGQRVLVSKCDEATSRRTVQPCRRKL